MNTEIHYNVSSMLLHACRSSCEDLVLLRRTHPRFARTFDSSNRALNDVLFSCTNQKICGIVCEL